MSDSSVSTKNVWPYYAKTNVSNVAKEKKTNDLGKDQFLKILITQLRNQDPSQPLQDKEFIAQMAQFTSVEQLSNMSNEMKLLRQSLGFASGLIGKSITWTTTNDKGENTSQTGVVESITVKDGAQFAVVGKEKVAMDKITSIANPEEKK